MLKTLIKFLNHSSTHGTPLLAAHDVDKGKASATLLFAHVANALAICTIIYLAAQDAKSGAVSAIIYSVITMVLYLMRRLSKFSLDVDDAKIDIESAEKDEEK